MCLSKSVNTLLNTGLEVINLELILKLKIQRIDWLLACLLVRKQPIIALYFKFENELKIYNLGVWFNSGRQGGVLTLMKNC